MRPTPSEEPAGPMPHYRAPVDPRTRRWIVPAVLVLLVLVVLLGSVL